MLTGAEDHPGASDWPTRETAAERSSPGRTALFVVVLVLLAGAALSCVYGFISPDSWDYLFLAQSLRRGLGCTQQGAYFAAFPCGYPLAIALASPFSDIASMLVSSKLLNAVLLFATFIMLARSPLAAVTAALVALNPSTLRIFQFTWSENLFLFAFAGALACIAVIHAQGRAGRCGVLLALSLMIGCSSRYVFGPFAALMFVCVAIAWGGRTALRALPSFVVAGLFFWAYQTFNVRQLGFATGIPRIPSPESVAFLSYAFGEASVRVVVTWIATAILFLALAGARFSPVSRATIKGDRARCHLFLLLVGAGDLLMQFALRVRTQFDVFDVRTLAYGYVFLLSGAAGLLLQTARARISARALAIYGVVCTLLAQGPTFTARLLRISQAPPVPAVTALRNYPVAPTDAALIVSLVTPRVSPTIEGTPALYYPRDRQVVMPAAAPYSPPETFAGFRARLLAHKDAKCVLDFTPFDSADAFSEYVDATYPVDVRAHSKLTAPQFVRRDTLDPTMRDWLRSRFVPGRYVDCGL